MKDVAGRELALGQKVATNVSGYTDSLVICMIVAFTAQKVRVEYRIGKNTDTCLKFPRQLCLIT